ncbi:putative leader peptide [Pseudonocardia endophytica]
MSSVDAMTGTWLTVREHIDLLRVASALCRI